LPKEQPEIGNLLKEVATKAADYDVTAPPPSLNEEDLSSSLNKVLEWFPGNAQKSKNSIPVGLKKDDGTVEYFSSINDAISKTGVTRVFKNRLIMRGVIG